MPEQTGVPNPVRPDAARHSALPEAMAKSELILRQQGDWGSRIRWASRTPPGRAARRTGAPCGTHPTAATSGSRQATADGARRPCHHRTAAERWRARGAPRATPGGEPEGLPPARPREASGDARGHYRPAHPGALPSHRCTMPQQCITLGTTHCNPHRNGGSAKASLGLACRAEWSTRAHTRGRTERGSRSSSVGDFLLNFATALERG